VARGDVDHAHVEDASDRDVGGHVRVPGDVKIRTGRVGSRDAYAEAGVDHVQCDVRCGADEGRLVGPLKVKEAVGGHFFLVLGEVFLNEDLTAILQTNTTHLVLKPEIIL